MPRSVQSLIFIHVLTFLAKMSIGDPLIIQFALWPFGAAATLGSEAGFRPWQLVTYSFLHADLSHLLFTWKTDFSSGVNES